MSSLLQYFILILVILVIVAEFYKTKFERSEESKDERGLELIYKSKSLSYSILSGGILLAVILVGALKLIPYGGFIIIVMCAYFIQSIASSIYIYQERKL